MKLLLGLALGLLFQSCTKPVRVCQPAAETVGLDIPLAGQGNLKTIDVKIFEKPEEVFPQNIQHAPGDSSTYRLTYNIIQHITAFAGDTLQYQLRFFHLEDGSFISRSGYLVVQ